MKISVMIPTYNCSQYIEKTITSVLEQNNVDELKGLLNFKDEAAGLVADPVSSKVNATRNNGPELIAPIELGEPETLF